MRVNFKLAGRKLNRKDRKAKRLEKALDQQAGKDVNVAEMAADGAALAKLADRGLSVAKRKQIFKKHKAKDVKAQIVALRIQSQKLNKKDGKAKAEKGKIAKQIKELRARIQRSGGAPGEDSDDSDWKNSVWAKLKNSKFNMLAI